MKRIILLIISVIILLILLFAFILFSIYRTRLETISTIEKITEYDDYNLYEIDIKYDYSLKDVIDYGIKDNQSFADAILKEALPLIHVSIKVPSFGCSAFTIRTQDGKVMMGRNYDFKLDTSALLVHAAPADGYKSIAFAALNNIGADNADKNIKTKLSCLTAPFVCLDGINEKGVSIAVLTLDSKPTDQSRMDNGKKTIGTSLVIRLVLDYAATTEEAVKLIAQYNMLATSGRDYHFYITDASGDGRVVEFDCNSPDRKMTVTKSDAVTNFFIMYKDLVEPNQKNEQYGHGKERYNAILETINNEKDAESIETAWNALKASSQEPNPEDVTSNTQWSIVFSNTDKKADIALRRHWDLITSCTL